MKLKRKKKMKEKEFERLTLLKKDEQDLYNQGCNYIK